MEQATDIQIVNVMGQSIKGFCNISENITINIQDLSKGMYFVRIGNNVRNIDSEISDIYLLQKSEFKNHFVETCHDTSLLVWIYKLRKNLCHLRGWFLTVIIFVVVRVDYYKNRLCTNSRK
ncbi:MAG: T9SS type A sorting domain-containing protein [Bacteroidales bacterium]|nr:T9SS type A sorting domain-containing protein [Bacteroidales bacterium]